MVRDDADKVFEKLKEEIREIKSIIEELEKKIDDLCSRL
jgi:prefoldin subunit 5